MFRSIAMQIRDGMANQRLNISPAVAQGGDGPNCP